LNTPDGVVDLRSGEMRPATQEDYCSKITAVSPAPRVEDGGRPPDRWLTFLDRVLNKNDELIAFLQRLLGYCLTGEVSEHMFAFLYGTGRNGKSVLLNTASRILNDYATTTPVEVFLESKHDRHPTDEARLLKVRLTTAREIPQGRAWNAAKIKNLTGGDKIPARFMRQDTFEFWPNFKLMLAANHKPRLQVVDEAMRSRLKLIPFTVTIHPSERDPDLGKKLMEEVPRILRWMIDGCLAWQASGLGNAEAVGEASGDYFHDQDKLAYWLDERTERWPMGFTETSRRFADWKEWATENGFEYGNDTNFSLELQRRGWTHKRYGKARGFKDLSLKVEPLKNRYESGNDGL
jgi:putative DNA primase/helicase